MGKGFKKSGNLKISGYNTLKYTSSAQGESYKCLNSIFGAVTYKGKTSLHLVVAVVDRGWGCCWWGVGGGGVGSHTLSIIKRVWKNHISKWKLNGNPDIA